MNSWQQERLGEENALPVGGIEFPAQAKLPPSSVGSNSPTITVGPEGKGKHPQTTAPLITRGEVGMGLGGQADLLHWVRGVQHVCAEVRWWKEPCKPIWSTSECCLPRLSLWVFSSISGGCCYVVIPQLFLSCFLSSLSFAGSVPSRPADLLWAEMSSRNHTHTHTHWVCLIQPTQSFGLEKKRSGHFICSFCVRAFLKSSRLKVHMSSPWLEKDF